MLALGQGNQLGDSMTPCVAVSLGGVMSALRFGYLFITRRLANQPFKKWDMLFAVLFFVLTAVLIQWTLHFLEISEIHERRRFFAIAMGLFLASSLVMNLISGSRNA
jgi:uncharacterized oligopeptide transporter (OPT) family protein